MKTTKVKFLIEKENVIEGKDIGGDVFAFFPELQFNYQSTNDNIFTCYAHIGQHSGCHIDYANECKEATYSEYKDLLRELISIGYKNLEILNTKPCILSNQYGFPCKTYWYIVNGKGETYHHKDKKFRRKELKELTTYYYTTEESAKKELKLMQLQTA